MSIECAVVVRRTICWTVTLFCLGMAASNAQLTWEQRQLDFNATNENTNIVARFTFSNAGLKPVKITEVVSSCACTTAKPDKTLYAPGDKGEIVAVFTVGNRVGLQQKNIVVRTDDESEPVTILTMRVFIPEYVRVSPVVVYWRSNEENLPKTIRVEVVHTEPIRLLDVESTNDRLFGQLKTVKPGKEYEIVVSPDDTREPARATFRIRSDFPKGRPRTFYAYAQVNEAETMVSTNIVKSSVDAPVAP